MTGKRLSLWTDGGARGNPGPAAAGVVITEGESDVWESGIFLGHYLTNNQAEYKALLLGLGKARELGATAIQVHMDSQLVVEQVNGRYKVKDPSLKERWDDVQRCLEYFSDWQIIYVPRADNSKADRLVNKALDEQN